MIGYTLMKLNKINDFRIQPAWYEYVFLYSVTAVSSIILGVSLLNKISGLYGWLALILIISVSYIYSVIKRTRDTRAKQYYLNTIQDYSRLFKTILYQNYNKFLGVNRKIKVSI